MVGLRLDSRILTPPYALFIGDVQGLTAYALGLNIEIDYNLMEISNVANIELAVRFPHTRAIQSFLFSEVLSSGVIIFSPEIPDKKIDDLQIILGIPQDLNKSITEAIYGALNIDSLNIPSDL